MAKEWFTSVSTVLGTIYVIADRQNIHQISVQPPPFSVGHSDEVPILQQTAAKLNDFISGKIRVLDCCADIPLSPFQRMIFERVCRIPYATTMTYAELAQAIGKPHAVRAVKEICKGNPLWIAVPTHRVIDPDAPITRKHISDAAEILRRMEKRYEQMP